MFFNILFKFISMFLIAINPFLQSLLHVDQEKSLDLENEKNTLSRQQKMENPMEWHDSIQLINK
ncbi:hypothetical protein [Sphingobacterium mizutaii]|uniref:hypothetical protein n=1 Tax=Sphingobacterium mizutaii TaxID=1010 RepID=UPI0028A11C65|nr:hypothetical protein [Sphingobacterium mizutaii]